MKTQLQNELDMIPDAAVRSLAAAVLTAAPECFWRMPAATTGKYHPAYALGDGGLVRHTKAVVRLTAHLLNMEGIDAAMPDYSLAIAAAILHDSCKKNDNETYTAFDHPLRAAELIQTTADIAALGGHTMPPPAAVRTLCAAVACHMGRWNSNPRTGQTLPVPLTPLQRLVHTADYLASRKDLSFDGIS